MERAVRCQVDPEEDCASEAVVGAVLRSGSGSLAVGADRSTAADGEAINLEGRDRAPGGLRWMACAGLAASAWAWVGVGVDEEVAAEIACFLASKGDGGNTLSAVQLSGFPGRARRAAAR